MHFAKTALSFVILLVISVAALAQPCPPNIDFEMANYSNWYLYTGVCCPINTPTLTGPVANRHSLMSGSGTDLYGGFPVVDPASGNYSLKLGNDLAGAQGERARYYLTVPPLTGEFVIVYRYAVVLQDPSHPAAEQPRFEVKAVDSATGKTITCSDITYVASSALPGFTLSSVSHPLGPVYYKSWSSASLIIGAQYSGKTIAIDFASGDCAQGQHFGYGYVDMNCSFFQTSYHTLCNQAPVTVSGPPGYQAYRWTDVNFTTTYATTQNFSPPPLINTTTYALILTPYTGVGCADTLYSVYHVNGTILNPQKDTLICYGDKIQLSSSANAPIVATNWSPAAGLSCTSCTSPQASPAGTTLYYNTVTEANGCVSIDSMLITVDTILITASSDTTICAGSDVQLSASSTNTFTPLLYSWTPATGLSCTNCTNPVATVLSTTTYTVTISNNLGCSSTAAVKVNTDDSVVADIFFDKDSLCIYENIDIKNMGPYPPGSYHAWTIDTGNLVSGGNTGLIVANWSSLGQKQVILKVSSAGCSDSDTAIITIVPPPIASVEVIHDNCIGSPVTFYPKEQDAFYYWDIMEQDYKDSLFYKTINFTWQSPGVKKINLELVDRHGCTAAFSDSVTLHTLPYAKIDSIDKLGFCNGDPAAVYARFGNYYQYQWAPAAYFNNNNSQMASATITTSTYISLKVTDQWACTDTDSLFVNTESCCDIILPDAFTPNGDGRNDKFGMIYIGDKTIHTFIIVNRGGKVLFESNNAAAKWDGTWRGEPQDPGTYFYYLHYLCEGKPIVKKQSFILVR